MFWKTKQRSITPLEEIVLTKMNLFLSSIEIIFRNQEEERSAFIISRYRGIYTISSANKKWKIEINSQPDYYVKTIALEFNDHELHYDYYKTTGEDRFNQLCEKADHLFTLYVKYKDAGLMGRFYDLTDRTDKIASNKRNK